MECRAQAKSCRAWAAFILIVVDCWFLISAARTLNRFYTVDGRWMKGAQLVGIFVVTGSSRVSFKRIAEKSKARDRSKTERDCRRVSVIIFALSGAAPPSVFWPVIAICCMACCV